MLDFVGHLHLDILAAHADLDFVHDVGDGLHGIGHVSLAEFFFRRDEAYALLEQFTLGDRCIGEVAEDARAHVDDDVLHLRVFVDIAQKSLELGPLRNRLGRLARLNEFMRDGGSQLSHFAHRFDALRRDAVTVLVDVSRRMQLPRSRDAQV
nr:hypothetical protein [Microbacterium testaceum]